ncbi:protein slit-like protein [Leptotrombidium deliense]|uniref:Protein slit-like protein n=1 Tax=Leptotrombidium deliense TaxID=299467 RepID=A0A443SHL1_9ACAR|nr:protein slit-like protein [Leptotrombidium deliense]
MSSLRGFIIFIVILTVSRTSARDMSHEPFYAPRDIRVFCPPEDVITPCKCHNTTGILQCFSSLVTDASLSNVFSNLAMHFAQTQEKHVRGLQLYKTEVTHLNKEILGEISMECVDMNGNQNLSLNRLHRVTFATSKSILKTFIYTGVIEAFWVEQEPNDGAIFEIVDGFMQLTTFWVSETSIPSIQRSAFGRWELPNMKTVYLAKNEIQDIGDYAFYRLPNLTYLNLQRNSILKITNDTFAFEKASEETLILDLTYNLLTMENIEKGAFTRLNRPVTVYLNDNFVTYLDEDVFKPIISDERNFVSVKRNPIVCDCRMSWLLGEDIDFMARVEGLTCKGRRQIWYYTVMELDNQCNVTVESSSQSFHFVHSTFTLEILVIIVFMLNITSL